MDLKDFELLLYKKRDTAIKICFQKNEAILREAINEKGDLTKHPNVIEKLHYLKVTQELIMESVKKYFTLAREKRNIAVNNDHFINEINILLTEMDAELHTTLTELNTQIKNDKN